MNYLVMEIQTMSNGQVATLIHTENVNHQPLSENEAESVYHTILASAALSDLPCHSAVMMTTEGIHLQSRFYRHEA